MLRRKTDQLSNINKNDIAARILADLTSEQQAQIVNPEIVGSEDCVESLRDYVKLRLIDLIDVVDGLTDSSVERLWEENNFLNSIISNMKLQVYRNLGIYSGHRRKRIQTRIDGPRRDKLRPPRPGARREAEWKGFYKAIYTS